MRMVVLICMTALLLGFGSASIADDLDVPAALLRPAQTDVHGSSLPEVAGTLLQHAGVPLAVEDIGVYVAGSSADLAPLPVSLHLAPGTSIADALDAAIKQDSRYEWKVIGCWVHVMPRERKADYILDQPFTGNVPQRVKPTDAVTEVMACFPAGWRWGIGVGGARKLPQHDCAALPKTLTVREAVDAALWRSGASCWEVLPSGRDSVKTGATLLLKL